MLEAAEVLPDVPFSSPRSRMHMPTSTYACLRSHVSLTPLHPAPALPCACKIMPATAAHRSSRVPPLAAGRAPESNLPRRHPPTLPKQVKAHARTHRQPPPRAAAACGLWQRAAPPGAACRFAPVRLLPPFRYPSALLASTRTASTCLLRLPPLAPLPHLPASCTCTHRQPHPLTPQLHHLRTPAVRHCPGQFRSFSPPALFRVPSSCHLDVPFDYLIKSHPVPRDELRLRLEDILPVRRLLRRGRRGQRTRCTRWRRQRRV